MTKSRTTSKRNKGSKTCSKAVLKAAIEVKNCRKHSVSDSDSSGRDNGSSDEEPPKCRRRKKVKPMTKVEEVDDELEVVEVEEVVDSEEPGEEQEDERRGTAQKDKRDEVSTK